MIAANLPVQRPSNATLLTVDGRGHIKHQARSEFVNLLRLGDVVVANDAATLPASLFGQHSRTGRQIEVRLAGRDSLDEVGQFSAVVFGEGDSRTRTESRSKPPALIPGDRLELGRLRATCPICTPSDPTCRLGHLDINSRSTSRLRAAFSWICS